MGYDQACELDYMKFVREQLQKRIMFVIEWEGYETSAGLNGVELKQLYDTYGENDQLHSLKRIFEETHARSDANSRNVRSQVKGVDEIIKSMAERILGKASCENIEPKKLPETFYDYVARVLQNEHNEKLFLVAEDLWYPLDKE